MPLAIELAPRYGVQLVAEAMGLSAATLSRRFRPPKPKGARPSPHRTLAPAEEQVILDVLHSERFVDVAPAEVVATLLRGFRRYHPRALDERSAKGTGSALESASSEGLLQAQASGDNGT